MFGLFGPEVVEYVGLKHKTLSFTSKKKRKPGLLSIRFVLKVNDKKEKLDLQVHVSSVRPIEGKRWLCSGELPVADNTLPKIEILLASAPRANLGVGARRSERHVLSLRVLSNDLPGFRGVTIDLSKHGVQVSCQGKVNVGKKLALTLELDAAATPSVTLNGECVWCKEGDRAKTYFIGVDFVEQDPANQEIIEKYYKIMEARAGSDVMMRTMDGGDVYMRPDDNRPPGY